MLGLICIAFLTQLSRIRMDPCHIYLDPDPVDEKLNKYKRIHLKRF
jgi:hypothetical protein